LSLAAGWPVFGQLIARLGRRCPHAGERFGLTDMLLPLGA
jgi:hypothetical protein